MIHPRFLGLVSSPYELVSEVQGVNERLVRGEMLAAPEEPVPREVDVLVAKGPVARFRRREDCGGHICDDTSRR